MKKLKIIVCIMLVFSFLLNASAFFSNTSQTSIGDFSFISPQSSSYVLTVSSEYEFRKITTDTYFNSSLKVSNQTNRKIIRLLNDISLTADLEMSCDFNMDLNGKQLNLGGHFLTVKHNYSGDIAIFGGTIISNPSGGKLKFDTPNATHSIPTSVVSSSLVEYLAFDATALKDRIFSFVDNQLTDTENGNYYYTDIVLPTHYYTYDIDFAYTSSDQTVLSNAGKILDNNVTKSINFALVLTIDNQTFAKTSPITVWVVPLSNKAKWLDIATELFDNSIAKYYGISDTYYVSTSLALKTGNSYSGITYSFSTTNNTYLSSNILNAYLSQSSINLTITSTIGGVSGTPFVRKFQATAQQSNYQIISDAMAVMFPNGSLTFNSLTSTYTIPQVSGFNGNITFTFMNNSTNYLYNNRVISVNSVDPPTMLSQNYLNVDFYLNDANSTHVIRRVKLNYNPTDGSDSGGSGSTDYFSNFYFYLHAMLTERTNGLLTYTSFVMPKSYNQAPKFQYRLVTQYANGSTYSGNQVVSITDETTAWKININTNNVPLQDLKITVYYQYTFNSTSSTYVEYTQTSSFIIPGIVQSGTNIVDSNLYSAIKAAYCPTETVLLSSTLSDDKALFEVHNSSISNFKGIEYLENTTSFNFSGCSFANSSYTYLSNLKNLKSLNLSSNAITDISSFPLLSTLTSLNLASNSINRFDRLDKLKGLQSVYVHGQTGTLTNYGNNGVYNSYTFIMMSMSAVSVYKADASTVFVPTANEKTAAKVLSGIIYQYVAPSTTAAIGKIPASVAKASAPTATYTLTKTVLTEASSTVANGLFVISTSVSGTTVYRLLPVTYGTF